MSRLYAVEDVRRQLDPLGLQVLEMVDDTATAESAARALHTPVDTIVKSLLFFVGTSPVLVLVAGNNQVNPEAIARVLGTGEVRLARPREVEAITGYAVGGVPPVAHRQPLLTLIDRDLFQHGTVYAAAGSSRAVFAITPRRLAEISHAQTVDLG